MERVTLLLPENNIAQNRAFKLLSVESDGNIVGWTNHIDDQNNPVVILTRDLKNE